MARILLIDDDDSLRITLRLTLVRFGHTVIEACNGAEGLKLFPQADADLVITDIVMPEMEGLEVLMALRKTERTVKIIVMSGGGRGSAADYLRVARVLGASKVLEKPFSREGLLAAITEVLAGSGTPTGRPDISRSPDPRPGSWPRVRERDSIPLGHFKSEPLLTDPNTP